MRDELHSSSEEPGEERASSWCPAAAACEQGTEALQACGSLCTPLGACGAGPTELLRQYDSVGSANATPLRWGPSCALTAQPISVGHVCGAAPRQAAATGLPAAAPACRPRRDVRGQRRAWESSEQGIPKCHAPSFPSRFSKHRRQHTRCKQRPSIPHVHWCAPTEPELGLSLSDGVPTISASYYSVNQEDECRPTDTLIGSGTIKVS